MMQRYHHRAGFTLLELLVVIAIIGLLLALLLPAVQAAREAARRMRCVNNLKQVTLAIHNYESSHRSFPPGSFYTAPHQFSLGFTAYALPFLEQGAQYESIDFSHPHCGQQIRQLQAAGQPDPTSKPVDSLICPSDPRGGQSLLSGPNGPLPNSGNCGLLYPGNYMGMAGSNDPDIGGTFNGCGGMPDGNGMLFSLSRTRFRDVTDGTTQTVLMGERGIPFDLGWGWPICGGHECEHYVSSTMGLLRGNHKPSEYFLHVQHLWSWHPGGVHVALVDGSCRFLSYDVDYGTYTALTTRSGHEVIPNGF